MYMLSQTLKTRLERSALASKLTYDFKPCYAPERTHPKNSHGIIRLQTSNLVAISNNVNDLVVAFKGSTTIDDVITFLRITPKEFSFRDAKVLVHSGVLDMFRLVHEPLDTILPLMNYKSLSPRPVITFTGHSQGGSLALFASAYYGSVYNNNLDIICHTFGAPRVGNLAFHDWHAAHTIESINVSHSGDIVTRIPIGFGYLQNFNQKVVPVGNSNCNDMFSQHCLDTYLETVRLLKD